MDAEVQLRTGRMIVRLLRAEDAAEVSRLRADAETARYVPWEAGYPVERAEAMIAKMAGRAFDDAGAGGLVMGVELSDGGGLIGEAMIMHQGGDARQGVIGYLLGREHWGRGLATELARALVSRFFAGEKAHRVTASCDARNVASVRVLEKVPMRLEGVLKRGVWSKGAWVDECLFGLLREEWEGAKG